VIPEVKGKKKRTKAKVCCQGRWKKKDGEGGDFLVERGFLTGFPGTDMLDYHKRGRSRGVGGLEDVWE